MQPLKQNLVIADGQVAATATQITTGAASRARRLNVIFSNVGTQTETLIITTLRGGGANLTGTARRIHRVLLDPNWSLHIRGLPLNIDDSLLAVTTDAGAVDYVISMASEETELEIRVYDDNGLPAASPQIFEQLAAVLG
jgi:hypothetical protein